MENHTVTFFFKFMVYDVTVVDVDIVSLDAHEAPRGQKIHLPAPIFNDCSEKPFSGYTRVQRLFLGHESKAEYGKSLAPTGADNTHHGKTICYHTPIADHPVFFPPVP